MKFRKRLGIWMDHTHAHLKEYHYEGVHPDQPDSNNPINNKKDHLVKGESFLHNAAQPLQSDYYKLLAKEILEFNEVLLFGPAEAKDELFSLIKDDLLYANIKINVKNSGPLSEKQEREVIKLHFK